MGAHVSKFPTGDGEGFNVDTTDGDDDYRSDKCDASEPGGKRRRRNDSAH